LKIILTEIEGVLQDAYIGEQGHGASAKELLTYAVNKGIEKAGDHHSLLFPVQFLRYMRDYTYAQFDPKKPQAHVMRATALDMVERPRLRTRWSGLSKPS
jgi:hypothetical protein